MFSFLFGRYINMLRTKSKRRGRKKPLNNSNDILRQDEVCLGVSFRGKDSIKNRWRCPTQREWLKLKERTPIETDNYLSLLSCFFFYSMMLFIEFLDNNISNGITDTGMASLAEPPTILLWTFPSKMQCISK